MNKSERAWFTLFRQFVVLVRTRVRDRGFTRLCIGQVD